MIPLLNFIQVEGDLTKFQNSSLISLYVYKILTFLLIKVNMLILSLIAGTFVVLRQTVNLFNLVMIQRITSGIHKSINQEMFSALMNSSQKISLNSVRGSL